MNLTVDANYGVVCRHFTRLIIAGVAVQIVDNKLVRFILLLDGELIDYSITAEARDALNFLIQDIHRRELDSIVTLCVKNRTFYAIVKDQLDGSHVAISVPSSPNLSQLDWFN